MPLSDVWDEPAMIRHDLALCAAGIHPDATADQLDLSAAWLAWGTYADDYYPQVFGRPRDLPAAKVCTERLSSFMPLDLSAPAPEPVNASNAGWRTCGPVRRGR